MSQKTNSTPIFNFIGSLFQFTNISSYHTGLFENKISCEEVTRNYLKRIAEAEQLNAFINVYGDEALAKAKLLDERRRDGKPSGRLHGVIVSIKDVLSYKDHPLTSSSLMLHNFKAVYNATVVQRLLDEEAIIIGSCNCDEFAMGSTNEHSFFGPVKNPVDPTKVPGGSSGGSAAAVRANLCMVSIGSDTGGSVRQPADFCGIVGFKPSYGSVSRYGLTAYASSFDQVGILSKNADDAALVFDVISGGDDFDTTCISKDPIHKIDPKHYKDLKIGVVANALNHAHLNEEIGAVLTEFSKELSARGAGINDINFSLIDHIVSTYYVLTTAEASSNLSRFDGVRYGHRSENVAETIESFFKQNRSEGFGWEVKKRIMLGSFVLSAGYFDAYFLKAQRIRRLLVNEALNFFNNFDLLLLPTVPDTAFEIGNAHTDPVSLYLADIFTVYANLTGLPAVSIPLFSHSNGMPFGVQLIAAPHNEVNLLSIASMLLTDFKK